MEKRSEQILFALIKEHVKSGTPVGSEILVNKYKLGVSSATVRNEMARLEEEGYIMQPHTSAGRIPTERAYNLYILGLKEKKLSDPEIKTFAEIGVIKDEMDLKQVAKILAHNSDGAVFWAFHRHNLFYTGIANLLSQPEFAQPNLIYDISAIIDRIDEIIDRIFPEVNLEPQILVGSKNPFSPICSVILTKYRLENQVGLFGIMGPMRMNYEKNLALVKFIKSKLLT